MMKLENLKYFVEFFLLRLQCFFSFNYIILSDSLKRISWICRNLVNLGAKE
jgi:hypothetical protein